MEKKLVFFKEITTTHQQYLRHLSTIKRRIRKKLFKNWNKNRWTETRCFRKKTMPLVFDNYQENHLPVVVFFLNLS